MLAECKDRQLREEKPMSAVLSRRSLTRSVMFVFAANVAFLSMPMGTVKAQATKPIQEPITGSEELGDLNQPQQALAQFYRAFNTRDLKMMDENFAHSDEVAIDNPLGGIRRAADEPHKMNVGEFKSRADVHVEFWDYTIHRAGDVFWAVGRDRGTYLDGEIAKTLNVRTTRIFQLMNGRWRQMHHHGSIEDAKLLGDYQSVVRSPTPKTPK